MSARQNYLETKPIFFDLTYVSRQLLIAGFCLPLFAVAAQIEAPEALRELLQKHLTLPEEGASLDDTARLTLERRLRSEGADLLATEGYFSPQIDLRSNNGELVVKVEPGPQAHIGAVDLEIRGALSEEQRQRLRKQWRLPTGDAFRQAAWDAAKQGLLRELLTVDYAGARLLSSEAEVDVDAARVNLHLVYDGGPSYRYGEIRIEGLQRYSTSLVERYTKQLRSGEAYHQDDLLAAQTALQNSPYFSSVRVELDRGGNDGASNGQDASGATGSATSANSSAGSTQIAVAPVIIRLHEREPYEISLGAGVSSNTGARVEANYRNTDFLGRAWDLRTGTRIEQLSQSAYADVFFPPGEGKRQDSVGAVIEKSDIEGLGIERIALAVSRVQPRGSIEQRTGLSWQYERQSPDGGSPTINRALTPTIGWLWRYSKDPLDASEGIVAQLQLGAAAKSVLSDQSFVRTYMRYAQGFSLNRSNSLLLRGEVGVTAAPSREGIPQSNLFRAGGSNSVRGYSYQSLGVKEGSATLGGRYLLTLSAEYTHWLDEQWGVAAFLDAGQAADNTQDVTKLATGIGIGARWRNPAGALAIDLAYGTKKEYDGKLRLHFSLAVPF